jgi:chromosome partitioning protein
MKCNAEVGLFTKPSKLDTPFQTSNFMLVFLTMTNIICIANQKGGVGKTTTAINLSAALAVSEKRTLLVDCDPQGNATTGLGFDKNKIYNTLYHGMIGKVAAKNIVLDSDIDTLKIIPSRVELIGFEVEMMSEPKREMALKNLLVQLSDSFEYIIIDCPPSLSLLTVNALTASDLMLIPLQCEFYALEGLGQLLKTMKRIKHNLNPKLKIAGILLTMFDKRTNLSIQVAEDAERYFKHLVFKTMVPRNVRLGEAPSFGKPILLYDAASAGAQSYFDLAKEIMAN